MQILKGGKTIYHVDKVLRETGAIIDDGTDISELMSCFMKKEVNNPKFPALSPEVSRLNETSGDKAVCEVMEKYEKIAVQ